MHTRITFRNMDAMVSIENYTNEKMQKIFDFLAHEPTPIFVDLVLQPSKIREHNFVELRVKTPHYDLISNYEGPEFYKVLDRVIDVMVEELHRQKRKLVDKRNHRIKVSKLWEFQEAPEDEEIEEEVE